MGSTVSRTVEISISNNTKSITLKEPRTFLARGSCSKPPLPELFPRSSDTCRFSSDSKSGDVSGVLAYEAESFTLAIHFSNPVDYNQFSMKLGLELSPGKDHLGNWTTTYRRMSKGNYSSSDQDFKFARFVVGESHGTVRVSHGPIKVMAAMSYDTSSTLKVVLEEQKESGEEAETENPWDVKRDRCRRSEILQDLLWDIKDSPRRSWTD